MARLQALALGVWCYLQLATASWSLKTSPWSLKYQDKLCAWDYTGTYDEWKKESNQSACEARCTSLDLSWMVWSESRYCRCFERCPDQVSQAGSMIFKFKEDATTTTTTTAQATGNSYKDLGAGHCEDAQGMFSNGYYRLSGETQSGCQAQCDSDVNCVAYDVEASTGWCAIYVPGSSHAPAGWTFFSGNGYTNGPYTQVDPRTGIGCYLKQAQEDATTTTTTTAQATKRHATRTQSRPKMPPTGRQLRQEAPREGLQTMTTTMPATSPQTTTAVTTTPTATSTTMLTTTSMATTTASAEPQGQFTLV